MSNEEFSVDVRDLKKTYRDGVRETAVLKSVTLQVKKGETVAILGASGAGKSTLLHCIGGLDQADGGTIMIAGRDVTKLSEKEQGELRNRSLGFVYQFHHLLAEFTAQENVAMPLIIRGLPREEALGSAAETLRAVGLGERLNHLPSELSGGERQRTAIARAIVTDPDCILADEPTGNLDHETAEAVWDMFLRLAREKGTSVVIVTHDTGLAARCGRAVRLQSGVLEPCSIRAE